MDQNKIAQEPQLPDESYIERLFPKCPAKQTSGANSQKGSGNRRKAASKSSQEAQRRQVRNKVQQRSRRELEACRKKPKANGISSDSSDEIQSSAVRRGLKKSQSIGASQSEEQTDKSALTSLGLRSKSGKYAASQSLVQQLQRSQSSYTANQVVGTESTNRQTSADQKANKQTSASITPSISSTGIVKADECRISASGIVKSATNFTLDHSIKSSDHHQSSRYSQQLIGGDSTKNDNIELLSSSDYCQPSSSLIDNIDSSGARSILKSQVRRELRASGNDVNNSTGANSTGPSESKFTLDYARRASADGNDQQSQQLQMNTDTRSKKSLFCSEGSAQDLQTAAEALAMLATQSAPTTRTADLECNRDKIDSQNNIPDRELTEPPLPSSITGPLKGQQLDNSSSLDREHIKRSEENFGVDAGDISSASNRRKDDDRYINLFVYDHNSVQPINLRGSQIEHESETRQQTQPPEAQNPIRNHRERHSRQRVKRFSESNSDESFDSLKDNIEIPETLEEEEPTESNRQRTLLSSIADKLRDDSQLNPNIISVHHQASQQLLSTDVLEIGDNDANVVRNDASTDELCSTSDHIVDSDKSNIIAYRFRETDGSNIFRLDTDSQAHTDASKSSASHTSASRSSSSRRGSAGSIGGLQTVDEKAEISLNELEQDIDTTDKIQTGDTTDKMPANLSRRGFVPPGYPQRIKPSANPVEALGQVSDLILGGVASSRVNSRSTVEAVAEFQQKPINDSATFQELEENLRPLVSKPDSQRVKLHDKEESSLVSVKDTRATITADQGQSSPPTVDTNKTLTPARRPEHPPQMPSICEDPVESDLEAAAAAGSAKTRATDEIVAQKISVGLAKISLASSPPMASPVMVHQQALNESTKMLILESNAAPLTSLRHHKLPNETSHYSIVRTSPATLSDFQAPPRSSSLQFNTLSENESNSDESPAHMGSARSNYSSLTRKFDPNMSTSTNTESRTSSTGYSQLKLQPNSSSIPGVTTTNTSKQPVSESNSTSGVGDLDDDLVPTTRTALVFPRLDEGLSSEAESCEDDIDDDDERAMEADVDADDDEEEEEDDEDDEDEDEDDDDDDDMDDEVGASTMVGFERVTSVSQLAAAGSASASVDAFLRNSQNHLRAVQQQQQSNRLIQAPHQGQQPQPQQQQQHHHQQQQQQQQQPLQHPSSQLANLTGDHSGDMNNQMKPPSSLYAGYLGQDALEQQQQQQQQQQQDLSNKQTSMSNYSGQNGGGQPSYWMSTPVSSGPQANMSSQPTSSVPAYNQQRSSSNRTASNSVSKQPDSRNNSNMSAQNSAYNRDEAKSAANRLSSDTDNETDRLLGSQRSEQLKMPPTGNDIASSGNNVTDIQPVGSVMKPNANSREVLIEGVLFNVKYLGSTHTECEGRGDKEDRIHQAEMAVHEVKFRNGENSTATEVQLFISTEKIMVLDDKHRKIMMDHSLRTISYIADIGEAIVLIVRKKTIPGDHLAHDGIGRPISRVSCHVFESSESHTITKSISQAFQVAYTELLKANGNGDPNYLPKEVDYQEVLNSQEMSTDELEMFARKENQREVIVPKEKGEILGLSIVESGWGSVLPTVVIASLKHDGPAYRCKKLSVGDQILSVNGVSLVGLPLADCQEILHKTKNQRVARFSVVPCPITVEVKIKRPDTKYQLGFSVQNGVICSLLRGGIAERGGVRVGHRIMSINGTTVVGVPHEKIVTLLASSVGEIRMKTCLTSLYRLILGEENPVHF